MKTLVAEVQDQLYALFPHSIKHIRPCWDPGPWSKVYRLDLRDGTRLFLKGTPRSRNEARVTQHLHGLYPLCIPRVLVADLVPDLDWRWFILEDAGDCAMSGLSSDIAIEAARLLGSLQQRAVSDTMLSSLVPQCTAEHLQHQALAVCQWAMNQPNSTTHHYIQHITWRIEQATPFFSHIAHQFTDLPATIVHGDFWSGNIAVSGRDIHVLDWGDALWGVGGVSIITLILTSNGHLDDATPQIWAAYEQGWGRSISRAYREACLVASAVSNLVIDKEIVTSYGQGPERLPGLMPGLQDLEQLITSEASSGNHAQREKQM